MAALLFMGIALNKSEMKYNGKYGHTIGRIQYGSMWVTSQILNTFIDTLETRKSR